VGKKKRTRSKAAPEKAAATAVLPERSEAVAAPRDLWILLALIVATLAVYAQVLGHQFINLDDNFYITENPNVSRGLTFSGIAWAFTTFHAANWHPLTWLSHMLDSQLFGLHAGGHLFVNALLHAANTCLLFWFLRRATGARWPSAIVAALFALHPMHVESVAWAAERKDTLAAFFGLLTLVAYVRYVEARSWQRYVIVFVCLALGLMAKPMLVTWPFLLLLIDYWPLRRSAVSPNENKPSLAAAWWPLVREKLPLFGLVVASAIITYIAQSRGGAVRTFADAPVSLRVANAVVSYAKYLIGTIWPTRLAVYYPFDLNGIPVWQVVGSVLLLAAITTLGLLHARTRPYLIVGWLWFLGTLVPVIGVVQVGGQAIADRYHYLPSIGLFIAAVFGIAEVAANWRVARVPIVACTVVVLLGSTALTAAQINLWRDSVTLFKHTLAVTPDNFPIEYNLGYALGQNRTFEGALSHFGNALRINPDFFDALINMGMTLSEVGRPAEAVGYFERALRVAPQSSKAHMQLALALVKQDKKDDALHEFREALRLAPQDADVRVNLGLMLARNGKLDEATEHLNEAVRLNPSSAEAHNNLGLVLLAAGKARESIPQFSTALRLKPDLTVAQENLRRAEARVGSGRP
jgi:Flp pilus assembly protein TadD